MVSIETPRLLIRRLSPGDVPTLIALWTDPEVTRHMGGPREIARMEQVYAEELGLTDPPRYTLWYVLSDVWGQGYATEAAAAVRDAATRAGITRLIALIDPENPASARVARKIGMRLERDVIRPGGAMRQVYALDAGQGKSAGTS